MNRGAARGSETEDHCAIFRKDEVILPVLLQGMKERNKVSGDGIRSRELSGFELVALVAGPADIARNIRAAFAERDDVIFFQAGSKQLLRAVAISANLCRAYDSSGGGINFRRTASTMAKDLTRLILS